MESATACHVSHQPWLVMLLACLQEAAWLRAAAQLKCQPSAEQSMQTSTQLNAVASWVLASHAPQCPVMHKHATWNPDSPADLNKPHGPGFAALQVLLVATKIHHQTASRQDSQVRHHQFDLDCLACLA